MNRAMRGKTEGREESIDGSGLMNGCFREVFSAAVVLLACPYWRRCLCRREPTVSGPPKFQPRSAAWRMLFICFTTSFYEWFIGCDSPKSRINRLLVIL